MFLRLRRLPKATDKTLALRNPSLRPPPGLEILGGVPGLRPGTSCSWKDFLFLEFLFVSWAVARDMLVSRNILELLFVLGGLFAYRDCLAYRLLCGLLLQ